MDEVKKTKLIYSGELLIFAVVFVVLGILFAVGVFPVTDRRRIIFTYVTLVGGAIFIADFLWALLSKKRRKKVSLLDKILILPASLGMMTFDIFVLSTSLVNNEVFAYVIGADFIYIAIIYLIEGIYHYYHPIPGLFDDAKKSDENGEKAIANEKNDGVVDQKENIAEDKKKDDK